MDDLISRQAAIDIVNKYNKSHMVLKGKPMLGAAPIVIELEDLPAAQPQRMRGRWIPDNLVGGGYWVCTVCKHPSEAFAANVIYNYCPFCGADMKGEQDG